MKPNNLRARNAIVFLICYLCMDMVNSSIEAYMLSINEFDIDYYNKILQYSIYLSYLSIALLIATSIHVILWFRRAYFNLHEIGVGGLRYSEGWAAGAWFVPIMNLHVPYKIMNDIWIETQRAIFRNDEYVPNQKISIWWTCWIIQGMMGRILYSMLNNAKTIQDFNNANTLSIISNLLDMVAGLMLILIIKELSIYENDLYQSRTNTEESILFDLIPAEHTNEELTENTKDEELNENP